MPLPAPISASALDLKGLIRPGDTVVIGQGTGEPTALTEALAAQAGDIGPVRVFLGALFSRTFAPDAAPNLSFTGYGGIQQARPPGPARPARTRAPH